MNTLAALLLLCACEGKPETALPETICFKANWSERFTGQDFGKPRNYERSLPKFIRFKANWSERFTEKDFSR